VKLIPVFIDFETFWSTTHSLTKMNPIAYVMHPDTELISVAIVEPGKAAVHVFGEASVKAALQAIDWSDKLAVAHNMSGFDAMLLAWRCGVWPAMWGCTLSMARPHHAQTVGGSLGALVKHYNLGVKDGAVLVQTKGKHLHEFTPHELHEMKLYNTNDTLQCKDLFSILRKKTSNDEMKIIDMTTRMLVEPNFECDKELLLKTLGEEKARKRLDLFRLAHELGFTKEAGIDGLVGQDVALEVANSMTGVVDTLAENVREGLASAPKFAAFLEVHGVDVPLKPSPADPSKTTYAFAKTDQAYLDLQEHENPLVAAATRLRLDVKSTILESRIESFLAVAEATGGHMPIAKNYYAAHTGRFGGSMKLNQENLPRIPRDDKKQIIHKPTNALRLSLRAPKGKMVVVADQSGIEMRVNHFLWNVPYSTAMWKKDPTADLYRAAAVMEWGCAPEAVTGTQRQGEKVKALGLGFGAGGVTFKSVAKILSGGKLIYTEDEAEQAVQAWRRKHLEIVQGWKKCHAALAAVHAGAHMVIDKKGLCYTSAEGIHTPTGLIRYPGLHQEVAEGKSEWWYGEGRNRARIYAGKVTENIVQHLARNTLIQNALRVRRLTGWYPAHCVHDELIYVVPEDYAEEHLRIVQDVMRTPPDWWPELVVWSEGDVGTTYGETK